MAYDWTSRQECLDAIEGHLSEARSYYAQAAAHKYDAWTIYNTLSPSDEKAVFNQVLFVLDDIINCLIQLTFKQGGMSPSYPVPYFLTNYQSGPGVSEYTLTWKKIIAAWLDISDAGKMWTITSIDQMRQNIWNLNPNIKWTENPFE